jgi:O-methyltransferase
VMHYIDFKSMRDRAFYLVDTFNGIPLEQLNEAEKATGLGSHNAFYFDCYETVRQNFSKFPNARIIRGVIPEVLNQIDTNNISYVSIDMNCVMPEIAAGRYLWPRLTPGAIVVLDDYGWMDHIQQKHAWDAFAAELDLKILAMPTGQGLLIKP